MSDNKFNNSGYEINLLKDSLCSIENSHKIGFNIQSGLE